MCSACMCYVCSLGRCEGANGLERRTFVPRNGDRGQAHVGRARPARGPSCGAGHCTRTVMTGRFSPSPSSADTTSLVTTDLYPCSGPRRSSIPPGGAITQLHPRAWDGNVLDRVRPGVAAGAVARAPGSTNPIIALAARWRLPDVRLPSYGLIRRQARAKLQDATANFVLACDRNSKRPLRSGSDALEGASNRVTEPRPKNWRANWASIRAGWPMPIDH